jgi:hypothetical protein
MDRWSIQINMLQLMVLLMTRVSNTITKDIQCNPIKVSSQLLIKASSQHLIRDTNLHLIKVSNRFLIKDINHILTKDLTQHQIKDSIPIQIKTNNTHLIQIKALTKNQENLTFPPHLSNLLQLSNG